MTDDERRALYGRPAPGDEPAAAAARAPEPAPRMSPAPAPEPAASPAPEPAEGQEAPEPTAPGPTASSSPDRRRASARRRTAIAVAASVAVVAIVAAGAPLLSAVTAPRDEPSLAVFDREPTEREREIERGPAAGTAFGVADVEARLLLSIELDQGGPREVWAMRTKGGWFSASDEALVCLTTDPTGVGGNGPLGCMLEDDLARRGFIPLEQPRPTVVIDGEIRTVAWGPTGDARLIDPPIPPTDNDEP